MESRQRLDISRMSGRNGNDLKSHPEIKKGRTEVCPSFFDAGLNRISDNEESCF